MGEVWITGVGVLGPDVASYEDLCRLIESGASGLAEVGIASLHDKQIRWAGRVEGPDTSQIAASTVRNSDRATLLAAVATRQAISMAGGIPDASRVAVSVSGGLVGLTAAVDHAEALASGRATRLGPHAIPMSMPNAAAVRIAITTGARAGTYCPVSACASGADAIAWARDLIELGRADVVIAGGTDAALHPVVLDGFVAMRAIARGTPDTAGRPSVPFDHQRHGFVPAEGAAIVVMEAPAHAKARGARPLARLTGAAVTSDAYDPVAPRPDASAQVDAMLSALAEAGVAASSPVAVLAHATGTTIGDRVEAKAISSVIERGVRVQHVGATKAALGHSLGASGAQALAMAVAGISRGSALGVPGLKDVDPALPKLPISPDPVRWETGPCLVNCFGFGGQNVSLVLERPE